MVNRVIHLLKSPGFWREASYYCHFHGFGLRWLLNGGEKKSFSWTISNSLSTLNLSHAHKSGCGANQTLILFLWRNLFHVHISFPLLQGGISKQVLQRIRLQTEPVLFLINDQCSACYMTDQTLHIDNGYVNHCTVAVIFLSEILLSVSFQSLINLQNDHDGFDCYFA